MFGPSGEVRARWGSRSSRQEVCWHAPAFPTTTTMPTPCLALPLPGPAAPRSFTGRPLQYDASRRPHTYVVRPTGLAANKGRHRYPGTDRTRANPQVLWRELWRRRLPVVVEEIEGGPVLTHLTIGFTWSPPATSRTTSAPTATLFLGGMGVCSPIPILLPSELKVVDIGQKGSSTSCERTASPTAAAASTVASSCSPRLAPGLEFKRPALATPGRAAHEGDPSKGILLACHDARRSIPRDHRTPGRRLGRLRGLSYPITQSLPQGEARSCRRRQSQTRWTRRHRGHAGPRLSEDGSLLCNDHCS